METIVVAGDTHFAPENDDQGGHDEAAFACFLKALKAIKPTRFVHDGDVGEWSSVSPWKHKRRKRPPLDYVLADLKVDAAAVNEGMDRIDAALPKDCNKVILEGNHEVWISNMLEECADVARWYHWTKLLRLEERGYSWHKYGERVPLAPGFVAYHGGHWAGEYHNWHHCKRMHVSCAYGHTHDLQHAAIPSYNGLIQAWSAACLCKLDKQFLKGRENNWSHGFLVVHVDDDGSWRVQPVEIKDGRCQWGSRLIKG